MEDTELYKELFIGMLYLYAVVSCRLKKKTNLRTVNLLKFNSSLCMNSYLQLPKSKAEKCKMRNVVQ